MKLSFYLIPLLMLSIGRVSPSAHAKTATRPNVVVIMTDNHGAWTLGCYGNRDIRTPNIDRLAREGTLFTRAFASNPVCSPTRATFLTGLIPSQHGVHCFLSRGRLQIGPEARSTLDQLTTLPEVLREQGYSCGLVGKWHLGDNLRPQEGFDDYWITMPHGGTSRFYDAEVIEEGRIRKEPQYLTDLWTGHAVNFIEQSMKSDKPFFLFLAYNGPYALSRLMLREGRNRHAAFYAGKDLPSFPREPAHPWQQSNLDYHNNPLSNRRVATEVSGVDDGVGIVIETLKKHGLDNNTIVIFLADQGWVGGHGGFYGMGDHTRPLTAKDGMMRIPLIWRHPGKIVAGALSDRMVANYDVMPTLLSYLGLGDKMPDKPKSPGKDFSDVLRGKVANPSQRIEAPIFYEFENLRCIRTKRWKYVHRHPNGPHELYDLETDPNEFNNLVTEPAHATTRDELVLQLTAFYAKYAEPKYDLWKGGESQTRIFVGIDEELAQVNPVEPPPLSEGFTPQQIEVPPGFTVELVAGPPLVEHPTFATFDDRGRLFVSENAGVNMTAEELQEKLPNSIRLLEDLDGDGRFDKSTVFADRMTFPMGGAWHDGALYVASPPSIWRLEDTDGDGVADKRDVIVGEFGFTGNAASIHGCIPGPDGRLYWCDGFHGHEFTNKDGEITSQREGSYIFSCRPDGSDVRIHCGGGMDNPVEVDFTVEGEMLGTVNILYTRPRVDCLVHWLYGGAYPHRERILSEIKVTGEVLGPVHRFGHVTVSGTTRYRSGVMNHQWRDNMFVTFFNSGKVVRVETEREGSTFRATQREFLSCVNHNFHPTDVAEDADGSLLVVDTGGWFYRGCPTSQYAKPDIKGAIYRVRRAGMTTQVDPWGKRIDWSKQTHTGLVGLFNDTRFKVRERAVAECTLRGDSIVPTLSKEIRRSNPRQRLNTLWALTRIVGHSFDPSTPNAEPQSAGSDTHPLSTARAVIRLAMDDVNPSVRLAACRSLATYPDAMAAARLLEILQTETPPLRREAATALGRLGDRRAVPALLAALARRPDIDRAEEHAITYAIIETNDPAATRTGLSATSANTQRAALIALDQMDDGDLTADDVASLFASNDARLQRTAADVFIRHGDWSARAADVLGRLLDDPNTAKGSRVAVGQLAKTFIAEPSVGKLIGRFIADAQTSRALRDQLLRAISQGQKVPLHQSWILPLEGFLRSEDPPTVALALSALSTIKANRFREALQRFGADPKVPSLLRATALQIASGKRGALTDAAFDLLVALLAGDATNESLVAAQKIGSSELSKPQLLRLAARLESASPAQLRDLVRPYQRTKDVEVGKLFLATMEHARGFMTLAPHEFSDVIKRYPHELLPPANRLLERLRAEEQNRIARVDQLLPLLRHGNSVRGRELFFGTQTQCATCHRVDKQGGQIGPDLTTIGANRDARDLLESIVFPSATIVRAHETSVIETVDGNILSGMIVRETADTVYLQQAIGDPVPVARGDIVELTRSTVSIMPTGLDEALDKQGLADLVAFLMNLKGPARNNLDF